MSEERIYESDEEIQIMKSCWEVFNNIERTTAIKNSWYNPARYIRGKIEKDYKNAGRYENIIRDKRYRGTPRERGREVEKYIKKKATKGVYPLHRILEPIGKRFYRYKGEDNIIEDIWYHLSAQSKKEIVRDQKIEGLDYLISALKSYEKTEFNVKDILEFSGVTKKVKEELSIDADDYYIARLEFIYPKSKRYNNYFELFDDIEYVKSKRIRPVRSWIYSHPHLTSAILLTAASYSAYYISKNYGGILESLSHLFPAREAPALTPTPIGTATPTVTAVATTPVPTTTPTITPTHTPTITPTPTEIAKIPCPTNIELTRMDNKSYIFYLNADKSPSVDQLIVAKDGNLSNPIIFSGGNKTITFNTAGEHNVSVFSKIGEKLSDLCKSFNLTLEQLPTPTPYGPGHIPSGPSGPSVPSSPPPPPPEPTIPVRRGGSQG